MKNARTISLGLASIALVAVGASALGSPATATESSAGAPEVVAESGNAPVGSIMPNFTQRDLSPQGDQYSVTIDAAPRSAQSGQPITITGHTTGFAPGNWVNVWVRMPDGSQLDDGGTIANDGSFTLPATLMYPGENTVQVSAGAWPAEQWSAPVPVSVEGGLSTSAKGVVYHDLTGRPVVVAAATKLAGFRGATYSFCPARGGTCVHQSASAINDSYVGVYPVPAGGFLSTAAPNSSDFMKVITYQNL